MDQKELPRIAGKLRSKYLEMPEEIYRAKGIVIMGKRIKSVIFTTDIAIIRSCNADAVLAVYPFTPQQVISQSIINVAPMPVFVGVGGGITNGVRSAIIAKDAEGDGAWGVVVNAPVTNDNIKLISTTVDVPIIATVIHESADIQARLDAGVSILNVSAASRTPLVMSRSQGFGCSPIKAARELGSERRETVWSLSSALVGILRRPAHSTRGPGWTNLWYAGCRASGTAGWLRSGGITAESI